MSGKTCTLNVPMVAANYANSCLPQPISPGSVPYTCWGTCTRIEKWGSSSPKRLQTLDKHALSMHPTRRSILLMASANMDITSTGEDH